MDKKTICMVELEDYFDIDVEVPQPTPGVVIEHYLDAFDKFIVLYSGGKDSTACVLYLLELGVPKEKIELWHHAIDGRGEDRIDFFDWPITEDYCKKFAEYIGIPIYFSWRKNGFWGEIHRDQELNQPICYEDIDGSVVTIPIREADRYKISRMRFPQTASIRSGRYCSVKLKIEISRAMCIHRQDLQDKKVLLISGERSEESKARENYNIFEYEQSVYNDKRRHYRWRPVHSWDEARVWDIIRRWGIRPHPAYELGWGRTSCQFCIFGSRNMWATVNLINPERVQLIAQMELDYAQYHLKNKDILCSHKERCRICERLEKMDIPAYTINNRMTILELADSGTSYDLTGKEELIKLATSTEYTEDIYLGDKWEFPDGAFGENAGPT